MACGDPPSGADSGGQRGFAVELLSPGGKHARRRASSERITVAQDSGTTETRHRAGKEGRVFTRDGKSVMRRKCINCGDCMTGCNVGAKNTVYMSYLPLAKLGGAQIFTQTAVRHVEKSNQGWAVSVSRHK